MKIKNLKLIARTTEDLGFYLLIYKIQLLIFQTRKFRKKKFSPRLSRFMWRIRKGVFEKQKN